MRSGARGNALGETELAAIEAQRLPFDAKEDRAPFALLIGRHAFAHVRILALCTRCRFAARAAFVTSAIDEGHRSSVIATEQDIPIASGQVFRPAAHRRSIRAPGRRRRPTCRKSDRAVSLDWTISGEQGRDISLAPHERGWRTAEPFAPGVCADDGSSACGGPSANLGAVAAESGKRAREKRPALIGLPRKW